MFSPKKTEEKPRNLELALDSLITQLQYHEPDSKEFAQIAASIKVLTEANAVDQTTYRKLTVSPEVWATIGANLAGILLIINYERAHVITTKAMQQLPKIRL